MKFQNSRVLDIGFGRASFLYQMRKLGAIPYGVELDNEALTIARKLGFENVFYGDGVDSAGADCFDLVVLTDLVEHPLDPMRLLGDSHRALRHEGLLLIWTPNGDYGRREQSRTTFRVDLEHMQYLTVESCYFIAQKLGFRIVHLETLGFPNLSGIDDALTTSRRGGLTRALKQTIKRVPGFRQINRARQRLRTRRTRDGSYHLFCIMQKVA